MPTSSLKPLTLHAHTTGPNPIKIAAALEFLSIPYTVKLWQFGADEKNGVKGSTFLAINPNGRVPALEDPNTDVVSWESGAVMNYIRRTYDKQNTLGPKAEDGEQGIVDLEKWEYFLLTTLGPMTGQVNWFRYYHPSKNEDALNRYVEQTYSYYAVIEQQLAKSDGASVIPGKMTSADIHFYPWVKQHEFAGLSLDDYPNLKKWLGSMGERKEIKEGYRRIAEAEEA